MEDKDFCKGKIEKMLQRSQTKVIFPVLTLGLVREYFKNGKVIFEDAEIRKLYQETVRYMIDYLKHDLHIGGKYWDAYSARNLPPYGVLKALGNKQYELLPPYTTNAEKLIKWIPQQIKQFIDSKLGVVPRLSEHKFRAELAEKEEQFFSIITRLLLNIK